MNNFVHGEYTHAMESYEEAKEMLSFSKPKYALLSVRQSLESMVKEMCVSCGVELYGGEGELDLIQLIDKLKEIGMLSETETALLHRIRMLGNKGAHVSYGEPGPSMDQATEAVVLLKEALDRLMSKHTNETFSKKAQENNIPMRNPDYYSATRRYYGMWWNCYSREELVVIPEYLALKEKADRGDVSAMLDLAVGFLPKQITWSPSGLVCMPKLRTRDGEPVYQEAAYDARYYYWILKAGYQAARDAAEGKVVPLKYIANTFLEVAKFYLSFDPTCYYNYVSGRTYANGSAVLNYQDQYGLAATMFGEHLVDVLNLDQTVSCVGLLVSLMNRFNDFSILSAIHKENSMLRIKYLAYCYWCIFQANGSNGQLTEPIPENILLSAEDAGIMDAQMLLQKYTADAVCRQNYETAQKVIDKHWDFAEKPLLTRIQKAASVLDADLPELVGMKEPQSINMALGIFVVSLIGFVFCGFRLGLLQNGLEGGLTGMLYGSVVGILAAISFSGLGYSWYASRNIENILFRFSWAIGRGRKYFFKKAKSILKHMSARSRK